MCSLFHDEIFAFFDFGVKDTPQNVDNFVRDCRLFYKNFGDLTANASRRPAILSVRPTYEVAAVKTPKYLTNRGEPQTKLSKFSGYP